MAVETLYASSHLAGSVTTPNNALGAPNGTWTGDSNAVTSWTSRFAMDNASGGDGADGTATVTITARKGSNSGDPSISGVNIYENGTLLVAATLSSGDTITSTAGMSSVWTFDATLITSVTDLEVEVVTAAVGGSPSTRNAVAIDGIAAAMNIVAVSENFSGTATVTAVASSISSTGAKTGAGTAAAASSSSISSTGSNPNPPVTSSLYVEKFDGDVETAQITTGNTTFDGVAGTAGVFAAGGVEDLCAEASPSASQWNVTKTLTGWSGNKFFSRSFVKFNEAVTANAVIQVLQTSGGGNLAQLQLMTTGILRIRNVATAVGTAVTAITYGEWIRLEWDVDGDAGTQELRIYTGANVNGTTPDETLTGAYTNGAIGLTKYGTTVAITNTFWLDEIAIDDTATPGPLPTVPPGIAAASAASSIVVGGIGYDTATGLAFSEDFEGTPGASMDTGNTGFDIFKGTGLGTFESSPTPITGSTVAKWTYNGDTRRAKYDFASADIPVVHIRGYFMFGEMPSAQNRFFALETSETVDPPGEDLSGVAIRPDGKFRVQSVDGYDLANETATAWASTTEWVRLELKLDRPNDQITFRVFAGANVHGTVPDEELVISGVRPSSNGHPMIGVNVGTLNQLTQTVYSDAVAVSPVDWLGPAVTPEAFSGTASVLGTLSITETGSSVEAFSGTASTTPVASSISSTGAKTASGTAAASATSSGPTSTGTKIGSGSATVAPATSSVTDTGLKAGAGSTSTVVASSSVTSTGLKAGSGYVVVPGAASSVTSTGAKVGAGTASVTPAATSITSTGVAIRANAGTASVSAASSTATTGAKGSIGALSVSGSLSTSQSGSTAGSGTASASAASSVASTGAKRSLGASSVSGNLTVIETGVSEVYYALGFAYVTPAASSITSTGSKPAALSGTATVPPAASSVSSAGAKNTAGTATLPAITTSVSSNGTRHTGGGVTASASTSIASTGAKGGAGTVSSSATASLTATGIKSGAGSLGASNLGGTAAATGVKGGSGTATVASATSSATASGLAPGILFSEDYEGGSNGASITTGNTGFDIVINDPATFTDAYKMTGLLAGHYLATGVTIRTKNEFADASGLPLVFARGYYRFASYPSAVMRFATLETSPSSDPAGDDIVGLRMEANGRVRVKNGVAFDVSNQTADPIPLNEWVRMEFGWDESAGTYGTATLRIFKGANLHGLVPDVELAVPLIVAPTNPVTTLAVGVNNSVSVDYVLDSIEVNSVNWVGPIEIASGTASVSASGAVSVTGSRRVGGTASLAVTSSVSSTGAKTGLGTSSVSAASSISSTGLDSTPADAFSGTASVTGSSASSATGAKTVGGSAAASAASSISSTGIATGLGSGTIAISAAASASATGAKKSSGVTTLTPLVTAVSALGSKHGLGTASASGASSISSTGQAPLIPYSGTISLSGASAVSAQGAKVALGQAVATATVAISSSGATRRSGYVSASAVITGSSAGTKRGYGSALSISALTGASGIGLDPTMAGLIIPNPGVNVRNTRTSVTISAPGGAGFRRPS